jgi:hypothetical protein
MATSYNNFKDTTVRGDFINSAYPDNSKLPTATFGGVVNFQGDLKDVNNTVILNSNLQKLNLNLTTLSEVQANNNAFTGVCTFNSVLPSSILTPSGDNEFCRKGYVDQQVATNTTLLGSSNVWTGTNAFNNFVPATALTPVNSNDLCNKTYVDTKTTLATVLSNNNAFTGACTFNSVLPLSTLTPSGESDFCRKGYVDTKTTLSTVLSNNNSFSGTCTFTNTTPPACAFPPSGANSLCNKNYVDVQVGTKASISQIQASALSLAGIVTFTNATTPPSCALAPTVGNSLCNKTYVDGQVATKASISQVENSALNLSGAVLFTNANAPACGVAPNINNSLCNKLYVDQQVATKNSIADLLANSNTFTNSNIFQQTVQLKTIRTENVTDNITLFGTTTVASCTILGNAGFNGLLSMANLAQGNIRIGDQSTGGIYLGTGNACTSTVNIGRSTGDNAVTVGAFTFSGEHLQLPNITGSPSTNELGGILNSLGSFNQTLTTNVWDELDTITLPAGVWICTGSMNMSVLSVGTGTTISEILFGLSTTTLTVDAINYYSQQYDAMSINHSRTFSATNTRTFVNTGTTTIYLNIKCIFNIGTSTALRVNDCTIECVRIA